VRFGD